MHHSSSLSLYHRWASRLISLYPTAWRECYADEMLQILEDSSPSLKTVLDLSLNLFDAYTHQSLLLGRTPTMLQKLRANELIFYASAIFFFFAWLAERAYVNIADAHHMYQLFPYNLSTIIDPTSPLLTKLITASFYVLSLFILLGSLPLLFAASWNALKEKNRRVMLRCLLALVSPFPALILPIAIPLLLFRAGMQGGIPEALGSPWSMLILFALFMGLSVIFTIATIKRMEPSRRITHYALYVALMLTLAMLIGFVALVVTAVSTLVGVSTAPGDELSYLARHILLFLAMAVTIGTAMYSLFRALQTKRNEQAIA